jgi:hypothetical protein
MIRREAMEWSMYEGMRTRIDEAESIDELVEVMEEALAVFTQ